MSDVDWDLLADHLCGALAGTPDERRVSDLIAADPAWSQAALQLSGAFDQVAIDLQEIPPPEPMPAELAARLDEHLRELSAGAGRGRPHPSVPASTVRPEALSMRSSTRPASSQPGSGKPTGPARSGPGSSRPGRRRWSRHRRAWWGAGLAVAAGVAAITAVGLGPLGFSGADTDETTAAGPAGDAESTDQLAQEPPVVAEDAGLRVIATDTDYHPDSALFQLAPAPGGSPLDTEERVLADRPEGFADEAPAPPLDRLWADLQPCLAEVQAVHEPAPATVRLVDFARFQGDPAIVIWLTTGDGAEWVWVAGPDCGALSAGPDQLYQSRVG